MKSKGRYPIHLAMDRKIPVMEKIIKLLVNHSANLSVRDSRKGDVFKRTVFLRALSWGVSEEKKYRIIKLLLEQGADVNERDSCMNTSFHLCDNVNIAELLLKKKAPVNKTNNRGLTPLHTVNAEVTKFLIKRTSADIHSVGQNGFTPLHCAFMNSDDDKVYALIMAEANIYIRDDFGFTPVEYCETSMLKTTLVATTGSM